MNILPKKSWHVRTRKNIERVQRDEAEAERLAKIEEDRHLEIEQEKRIRELRLRAGVAVPETSGHINLFEQPEDKQTTKNKDHDEEQSREEAQRQQRTGLFNRLGRTEDVNRPWYCNTDGLSSSRAVDAGSNPKVEARSKLITNIYDPMTAILEAEQIVRTKRKQQSEHDRLFQRKPLEFYKTNPPPQLSLLPAHLIPPTVTQRLLPIKNDIPAQESDSSPEIIKVVRSKKVKTAKVREHRNKNKHKKHKKSSKHHKHDKKRCSKHKR